MSLNRTLEQLRHAHAVADALLTIPLDELQAAIATEAAARAGGGLIAVFNEFDRRVIESLAAARDSIIGPDPRSPTYDRGH